MLLEVSTSDESCLSVCVRLREASARARVSSTGLISHVSHPTHPATPQPTAGVATLAPLLLAEGFSDLTTGGTVDDGTDTGLDSGAEAAFAAAANSEGDGALDGGGVANVWRRGAFNMADKPVDEEVLGIGAAAAELAVLDSADAEEDVRLLVDEVDG